MATDLMDKIERLEEQLPLCELWLYVCYGTSFTLFVSAIIRGVEKAYLSEAFVYTAEEIKAMGPNFSLIYVPESVYDAFSKSLNAPWWMLFVWITMLVMLLPGILLSTHSVWRKVSLAKRFDLIFGYFISAWVVFLSIGAENPINISAGYIFLLVCSAIAIGAGYWYLRRKKDKAEEVFP